MFRYRFILAAALFAVMSLPTIVAATNRLAGTCPFDSTITTWTGQTETVNGRVWYVMQCVQGHRTLSPNP